jgi:hypothetical protein
MPGKVFISCGQRPPREKNIAEKIGKLLKEKFDLDYYLAFKIQGLNDIMKITEELKSSDYYLFIDFQRKGKKELPCSLFTHQELALAHHVGFKDIIAFQEVGAPLEGFLRYVQANPETFKDEKELLKKVEREVADRKWTKDYSRNLVVTEINRVGPTTYADHTGSHYEYIWHARIDNHRPDAAAVNTVCILDNVTLPNGRKIDSADRSYLKWALQKEYQKTILPRDYGLIDIFAVHADEPGIYLHSARDVIPREPISTDEGKHELHYKVFSEGFPLLSFSVKLHYQHNLRTRIKLMGKIPKRVKLSK